jgi:hypothetical protein
MQASGLSVSDDQVRALARELLAREEFARWRRPPGALEQLRQALFEWSHGAVQWLRGLWQWLPDWMRDAIELVRSVFAELLRALVGDGPVATPVRWLLGVALLALVVAAAVVVVRSLRDALARTGGPSPSAGPEGRERSLLGEADRLACSERFLEAAHCAQLAALELLLKRRWIDLARSEPNRTLRQRLAKTSLPEAERSEFASLLDRLESHWFRDRAEDRDLYLAWRGLHARLAALVGLP